MEERSGAGVVRFWRGAVIESEHRFAWTLSEAERMTGPPAVVIRSAAKPFQALVGVRRDVVQRLGLGSQHLALACASHGGSEEHVARVREILAAAGRSEADLECGPSDPRDPAAAADHRDRGARPARVTHSCSGKHAFGIATCVVEGWPVVGYLERAHPLQSAMAAAVAEAAGVEPTCLGALVDGCGMRTFALPLATLAAAFGRLAARGLSDPGNAVASAMRAHPSLVGYRGEVATELMIAEPGVVAKVGAEGVLAIGLPDGRGAAVKVRDGAMRALGPAAVAVARERLGLPAAGGMLDRLASPAVLDSRGETVGRVTVDLGFAGD